MDVPSTKTHGWHVVETLSSHPKKREREENGEGGEVDREGAGTSKSRAESSLVDSVSRVLKL